MPAIRTLAPLSQKVSPLATQLLKPDMPQNAKDAFAAFWISLLPSGLTSVGRDSGTVVLSATGTGTARGGTGPSLAVRFCTLATGVSGFTGFGGMAAVLKDDTSFLGAAAV
ncbi:hypothetical protein D3C87_1863170 [compost metagenome]